MGKRSKTRLPPQKSSSTVNLDDDSNLKAPNQVRKDVKDLLLKAIDDAAEVGYFLSWGRGAIEFALSLKFRP